VTVVTTLVCLFYLLRGLRVHQAAGIPCTPSDFLAKGYAILGRIAPRIASHIWLESLCEEAEATNHTP